MKRNGVSGNDTRENYMLYYEEIERYMVEKYRWEPPGINWLNRT